MSEVIQNPQYDAGLSIPESRIRRPMEVDGSCITYPMNRNKRQAIIFNHYEYDPKMRLNLREGTEKDVERLEKHVLPKFNFSVTVYNDLPREEILKILKEIKTTNYEEFDCLAIFVLSHGKENRIAAYDEFYTPDELWKPLSSDECESLAGKPKLIFINACRGNQVDVGGAEFHPISFDGQLHRAPTDNYSLIYNVPKHVDIFIAYSTFEGYRSHRLLDEGTWFIQGLCDVLEDEQWNTKDIKTIMTRVTNKVSLLEAKFCNSEGKYYNSKQVPVTVSTLMRDVYLM